MEILIIFLVAFLAAAILFVLGLVKKKKLLRAGKITKRSPRFYDEPERVITDASYEALVSLIKSAGFPDCRAGVDFDNSNRSVLLKSDFAWNATIEYAGRQNDKNVFKLSFTSYKARKGVPHNPNSMNAFLTAAEKMFLSLDPGTTVENG